MFSLQLTERVCPKGWAPNHRQLEGFVKGAASPFSEQELFDVFAATRDGGPSVVFFNYELSKNVFSRQEGAPTSPEHIPAPTDGSFAGFAARIKASLGGARYCLRMTEPHVGSRAVYERLVRLVAPLEAILAEQSRVVRTTVFVGDYEYTPFGVHVDPYPQIQCAISGARKALFWDDPYWAKRTEEERLAPWNHLDAAHVVDMPAGDAVYWAPAYEHAFSSCGEHAVALTVSFPEVPPPDSNVEALRRKSAHHFLNLPPARSARAFRSDQVFAGNPIHPIALASSSEGEATVVAAGQVFTISGIAALPAFVARVNDKAPFRYSDLAGLDEETARALVDVLYGYYAVDAIDG